MTTLGDKKPEIKIDVLGTVFSIYSDEEPEYLYRIIDYYKEKITEIHRSAPSADALKTAILTGIVIADEFFKLRDNPGLAPDARETALIAERLIRQLEGALPQDAGDEPAGEEIPREAENDELPEEI
jgi:cell division protein ZapA